MTRILTNLILLILIASSAFGQGTKSFPQQRLEDSVNRIIKQLEALKTDIPNINNEKCLDYSEFLDEIALEIYEELSNDTEVKKTKKIERVVEIEIEKELAEVEKELEESKKQKKEEVEEQENKEEFRENFRRKFNWDWDLEREDWGWKVSKNRRTRTYFNYTLGLNNLLVKNNAFNPDLNTWSSRTFELGIITKTRLGEKETAPRFTYGVSYVNNNFRLNDSELVYLNNSSDAAGFIPATSNITRSSFCVSYLTIPLGMEFSLSRKTVFGFNVFGGLRLRTSKEVEYNTELNERVREKSVAGYRVNDFAYGAKAYIGGKTFSVFGRYDVSSLFRNNDDYNILAFGIRFDL